MCNFALKAFPGAAVEVSVLWNCVTVSERGRLVLFVKWIDVGRIKVTFVEPLFPNAVAVVHFFIALIG